MEHGAPPVAAWSGTVGGARVDPLAHANPDVQLWSVGDSYLLRASGPWRPGASLADEHRVLRHLHAAGLSVAVPVPTDDGALCVEHRDRAYVLAPRLAMDNEAPELLPDAGEVCSDIGSAIGGLHVALAQYPGRVKSYEHDLWQHAFEESYPKLPGDVRVPLIDPHVDVARTVLRDLPAQLIHGDCNSGNVLLSNRQVSGFIDFDHLPVGQRIYDLTYYLVHRIRDLIIQSSEDDIRSTAFLGVLGSYVAGYHAANPLSEGEREALPAAMLAAQVSLTSWSHILLTELPHRAGPTEADKYARGVACLDWINQHFAELTATGMGGPRGGGCRLLNLRRRA
jgi:Ser/Thr protein kinase RdoA (MazF antagonist)